MSLARSRTAVDTITFTRFTTVGSFAITSISWRLPDSPVGSALGAQVFNHFLHRDLVTLGDFFGNVRFRGLGFLNFQPVNRRMSSTTAHSLACSWQCNDAIVDFQGENAVLFGKTGRQSSNGVHRNREPA